MKESQAKNKSPKTVKIDLSSKAKPLPIIIETPIIKAKNSTAQLNKFSPKPVSSRFKQQRQMTFFKASQAYEKMYDKKKKISNDKSYQRSYQSSKSNPKHSSNSSKFNNSSKFSKQFNKSVEKIKKEMFPNDPEDKRSTIKTLKAIGRNASERQKQIEDLKQRRKQNEKKLVEDEIEPVDSHHKSNFNYKIVENKTYVQFQNDHKQYLLNQQRLKQNQSKRQNRGFSFKEFQFRDLKNQTHEDRQPELTQDEIKSVCEIFSFCELDTESDKMQLQDLNKLIEQFERLYFLKVLQKKKIQSSLSYQNLQESKFYSLIKQFHRHMKIAFYRKTYNDIYDMIYFLKDTKKLVLVTKMFTKIKDLIEM